MKKILGFKSLAALAILGGLCISFGGCSSSKTSATPLKTDASCMAGATAVKDPACCQGGKPLAGASAQCTTPNPGAGALTGLQKEAAATAGSARSALDAAKGLVGGAPTQSKDRSPAGLLAEGALGAAAAKTGTGAVAGLQKEAGAASQSAKGSSNGASSLAGGPSLGNGSATTGADGGLASPSPDGLLAAVDAANQYGGGGKGAGAGAGAGGLGAGGGLTGANGGAEFGGKKDKDAMGTADPDDYFSRLKAEDNIFKIVEKRYKQKSMTWSAADALDLSNSVKPIPKKLK